MTRFLTSNSYVCPTKIQIRTALLKVRRVYELYKPITRRLELDQVEVSKWFGLRKEIMTKNEHILREGKGSLLPYHLRAWLLDYISEEEYRICKFIMAVPLVTKLEEWYEADQIFLGESDHAELIFALTEEI